MEILLYCVRQLSIFALFQEKTKAYGLGLPRFEKIKVAMSEYC